MLRILYMLTNCVVLICVPKWKSIYESHYGGVGWGVGVTTLKWLADQILDEFLIKIGL